MERRYSPRDRSRSSHVIPVVFLILLASSPRCSSPFRRYNPSGRFPPWTRLWDDEAAPARRLTPSCHAFLLEFVSELNDLAPRIVAFFFFPPLSFFFFLLKLKAKNAFVGLLWLQS